MPTQEDPSNPTAVSTPTKLRLECNPESEIVFTGDFRTSSTVTITVRNPSSSPLLYKIKTTSPHRYEVKPNKGKIAALSCIAINITLLPFLYKPNNIYQDKFLLQVCLSSKLNQEYSKHDFWSMVPKSELFEKKFKCIFNYKNASSGTTTDNETSDDDYRDEGMIMNDLVHSTEDLIRELSKTKSELRRLEQIRNDLSAANLKLKRELNRANAEKFRWQESFGLVEEEGKSLRDKLVRIWWPMITFVIGVFFARQGWL